MKVEIHLNPFFFPKFLDEMLGNFSVSLSLPEVMSYFMVSKNPLLEILEDQIYQDKSMPHLSGNNLIRCILEDLEFSMIECKEWSQKMKTDTFFYMHHAESAKETTAYEIGLLKWEGRNLYTGKFVYRSVGLFVYIFF